MFIGKDEWSLLLLKVIINKLQLISKYFNIEREFSNFWSCEIYIFYLIIYCLCRILTNLAMKLCVLGESRF